MTTLVVIRESKFKLDRMPSFQTQCSLCKTLQVVTQKMLKQACRECAGPRYDKRVRNPLNALDY